MALFDFLRDASSETRAARRAFSFLKSTADRNPRVNQIKKATGIYAGAAREAVVKPGVSVGLDIRKRLDEHAGNYKYSKEYQEGIIPGGRLGRAILGNDPIKGYTVRGTGNVEEQRQGTSLLNKAGVSKDITSKFAVPIAAVSTGLSAGLDLFGGGKREAGEQVIKKIAKATSETAVRKYVPDAAADVIKALTKTKDPNVVRNIMKGSNNIPKEVNQVIPAPPKKTKAPKTPELKEHPEVTQINETIKDQEMLIKHARTDRDAASYHRNIRDLIKERADINAKFNPDGTPKGSAYPDTALKEATVPKPLQITNNSGGPLVGEGISGAAQQSHLAKKSRFLPSGEKGSLNPEGKPIYDIGDATIPKAPVSKPPVVPEVPKPSQNLVGSQADTTTQDPFSVIGDVIRGKKAAKGQAPEKGLAAASKEQAAILSQERGAKFAKAKGAAAGKTGDDAYYARLSAQKGEHTKVDNPYADKFSPEESDQLYEAAQDVIYNKTPDTVFTDAGYHADGARLNTEKAVRKALGRDPGLPTASELKLIRLVSPKLADDVKAITPFHRKIIDAAGILFGNARSLKSSLDFSMGGRQGIFVAARHPVTWAKANVESVKYAKNGQYYKDAMQKLHSDEWGQLIDKYNKSVLTGGRGSEEAFAATDIATSKLAKDQLKVGNLVAGSERAYTGGLTKLRHDLLEKTLKSYGQTAEEAEAALGKKGMEGLIEAVSTLTGRGGKKGGFTDKHATTLQTALFSPKLWASRLQPLNPAYWNRIGPAGRKEAIQNYRAFAAVAGVVLSAAVAMGADVETDPRSSDFLKVKVGDTRYDILGGFQQNLVFLARELSGKTKSSTTGKITKLGEEYGGPNRLTVAADLVRNKANPVIAAGANILEGKDKAGNEVNPLTEIGQLFVPISLQNAFNNLQREGGIKSVAKGLPEVVGISSQEYGVQDVNLPDSQKEYLARIEKEGASPEKIKAATRLLQQVKTAPSRDNVSADIKEALRKGDVEKAKSLARDYNKRYSDSFNDWRDKYGKYKDEDLIKVYESKLISGESLRRWADSVSKEGKGLL